MIKKQLIVSIFLGLVACLSAVTAAETMSAEPGAVLSNSSSTVKEKVEAIQTYVAHVEKGLSSDQRKEEALSAGALKAVTDENWKKLHGYYDGDTLKRMKLYPQEGSKKTEEFYFYNNEPVFVFVEENGAGKDGHDKNAVGSKILLRRTQADRGDRARRQGDGHFQRRVRENERQIAKGSGRTPGHAEIVRRSLTDAAPRGEAFRPSVRKLPFAGHRNNLPEGRFTDSAVAWFRASRLRTEPP